MTGLFDFPTTLRTVGDVLQIDIVPPVPKPETLARKPNPHPVPGAYEETQDWEDLTHEQRVSYRRAQEAKAEGWEYVPGPDEEPDEEDDYDVRSVASDEEKKEASFVSAVARRFQGNWRAALGMSSRKPGK